MFNVSTGLSSLIHKEPSLKVEGDSIGSLANSARSGLRDLGQVFISLSLKWESEVILYSLILPPTPKFSANGTCLFHATI